MEKIKTFFQNKRNLVLTICSAAIILSALAVTLIWWTSQPAAAQAAPVTVPDKPSSRITVSVPQIKPIQTTASSSKEDTVSADEGKQEDDKDKSDNGGASTATQPVEGKVESAPPPSSEPIPEASEPQVNPADYARPANRNPPAISVDNSIIGDTGRFHGETMEDTEYGQGTLYFHVGIGGWMVEEDWIVSRFGEHPEATQADIDFLNTYQFSPFQKDGDYIPRHQAYYCATCHSRVAASFWENGKHFAGNPAHQ